MGFSTRVVVHNGQYLNDVDDMAKLLLSLPHQPLHDVADIGIVYRAVKCSINLSSRSGYGLVESIVNQVGGMFQFLRRWSTLQQQFVAVLLNFTQVYQVGFDYFWACRLAM